MKNFYVADLNAKGELLAKAVYDYEQLERIPGAGEVITEMATAIWRSPEAFEARSCGTGRRW